MQRKPRAYALTVMVLALSVSAIAQSEHPVTPSEDTSSLSMADQLAELRAQVARLEAALQQNHQGHTGEQKSHDKKKLGMGGGSKHEGEDMSGMSMDKSMTMTETGMSKGMKMGGMEMGMGKMKGMRMMGMMKGGGGDQAQAVVSSLPGFPGASRIYHIGASGFFLDHGEHLGLSVEQKISLGEFREQSMLDQATSTRRVEELEQELWELTASDEPNAILIEEKVREIETLRGDQRIRFIRMVGEAAGVLTEGQRQTLLGFGPQEAPSAKDHQH